MILSIEEVVTWDTEEIMIRVTIEGNIEEGTETQNMEKIVILSLEEIVIQGTDEVEVVVIVTTEGQKILDPGLRILVLLKNQLKVFCEAFRRICMKLYLLERPKLQLQPRTRPLNSDSDDASRSSIFGQAKPVDTTAREEGD